MLEAVGAEGAVGRLPVPLGRAGRTGPCSAAPRQEEGRSCCPPAGTPHPSGLIHRVSEQCEREAMDNRVRVWQ